MICGGLRFQKEVYALEYWDLMRRFLHIAKLRRVLAGKRLGKVDPYAGQWMPVLGYVMDHDGCSQAELAAFLRVTPASVALSTKRMQKAGYLEKEVDEWNLRRNNLHVTEAGQKLAATCRDVFYEMDKEAFQGFEPEELTALAGYLDRIYANMGGGRPLSFGEILDLQRQNEDEDDKPEA